MEVHRRIGETPKVTESREAAAFPTVEALRDPRSSSVQETGQTGTPRQGLRPNRTKHIVKLIKLNLEKSEKIKIIKEC